MFLGILRIWCVAFWVLIGGASAAQAASCICVVCVFDRTVENFQAISESMAPTLPTGECAVMTKGDGNQGGLSRGDVIAFRIGPNQVVHVFRIIAMGGDLIEVREGRVWLNGRQLAREFQGDHEFIVPGTGPLPRCQSSAYAGDICTQPVYRETLPGGRSYEIIDTGPGPMDVFGEFKVPAGHVFVMGDHRDNAADSRFLKGNGGFGAVRFDQIIGVFKGF